ncbi:MAG: single-stranded DNA-binding protein [Erysipelotrichaceae bacterium]|nr:single-stranded DNA-binding protein [Erysipelotrichaceae bacterium]
MNVFALAGHIIEEPVRMTTENGTKLCRLRISVDKNSKESEDDKEIYEVTVFRNLADEDYRLGQFIAVNGRLVSNNYKGENKQYYNANLIGNNVVLKD